MYKKSLLHDLSTLEIRNRGHLPHWEQPNATYAVTFRLADSLPRDVLDRLREEHAALKKVLSRAEHRVRMEEDFERELHREGGSAFMKDPRIADIVAHALTHFAGERYALEAWCVMPNHVHIVFTAIEPWRLSDVVHSWKSFTAHAINRLLRREGEVWQREYFDRIVRDERHLSDAIGYVLENPAKAGLRDWKWTSETWTAG